MLSIRKLWFPIAVSFLVAFFLFLTIWNLKYRTKETVGHVIASEVVTLRKIFERIDNDCVILGFDYQKNPINFLTVTSFVSSEVGPMNLTYPNRWKGPYVQDNPRVENKEYMIVHTKKGYFITPGEGVMLPNGKVIGKDILLDEDADVAHMMHDDHALYFEDMPLAAELKLGQKGQKNVFPIVFDPEETD